MQKESFIQFGLKQPLIQAIGKLHFKEPTPIQKKVIPEALKGRGIIGQSHTGSGKTHSFLLPILNAINSGKNQVQAVITAPTRELARQLYNEAEKLIKYADKEDEWKIQLLIGGTERSRDKQRLRNIPQIIVGTPHRIYAMIDEGSLSIYEATTFVVDEADLMIDLGLINDVDKVLVRAHRDIQLLVFSATIPVRLEHFLKKYLENPLHVKIADQLSPELLEHRLIAKRHRDVKDIIYEISQVIQPYLGIIFTNSKEDADKLFDDLIGLGMNVGIIHGGLSPRERKRVVKDIEDLRYEYVVATDLASRGIDIEGVSHVINAQLPKEEEFYVHRVGRTARAGLEGMAISLYEEDDIKLLERLQAKGIEFQFVEPKSGEWRKANSWEQRQVRKRTGENLEQEAWRRVRKPKKVKPGYKKKMRKEQEAIKRQLVRKNFKKR